MAVNPIEIYNSGVNERTTYLQNAEALAQITVPELKCMGSASSFGLSGCYKPSINKEVSGIYNNAGTQAVTGLASTVQALHFPNQVDWFKLQLPQEMLDQIIARGITEAQIDGALAAKQKGIKHKLSLLNYQATIGEILLRLIVEGNVLVFVDTNKIRVIPLRSFVVKRYNGDIRYICYCEDILKDKNNPTGAETEQLYTLIDYENGEVWQQKDSNRQAKRVRRSPKQYFVVTSVVPSNDHYACSFGYRHYGLIYAINNFSYHLHRAAAIANKAIMFINPDSGLTPQAIESLQGGQAVVGRAEDIGWLATTPKITDWAWVNQYVETLKLQLSKAFALDLLNQPQSNQPKTATEISLMGQAVDSHVASLAQTTQMTLVKALVEAVIEVLKQDGVSTDLLGAVTPIVTSGTSAFDSLVQFQKLLAGFATVAQFDPTLTQRIDSIALLKTYSGITGINTDDYIKPLPQGGGLQFPQTGQPQPPMAA